MSNMTMKLMKMMMMAMINMTMKMMMLISMSNITMKMRMIVILSKIMKMIELLNMTREIMMLIINQFCHGNVLKWFLGELGQVLMRLIILEFCQQSFLTNDEHNKLGWSNPHGKGGICNFCMHIQYEYVLLICIS